MFGRAPPPLAKYASVTSLTCFAQASALVRTIFTSAVSRGPRNRMISLRSASSWRLSTHSSSRVGSRLARMRAKWPRACNSMEVGGRSGMAQASVYNRYGKAKQHSQRTAPGCESQSPIPTRPQPLAWEEFETQRLEGDGSQRGLGLLLVIGFCGAFWFTVFAALLG